MFHHPPVREPRTRPQPLSHDEAVPTTELTFGRGLAVFLATPWAVAGILAWYIFQGLSNCRWSGPTGPNEWARTIDSYDVAVSLGWLLLAGGPALGLAFTGHHQPSRTYGKLLAVIVIVAFVWVGFEPFTNPGAYWDNRC